MSAFFFVVVSQAGCPVMVSSSSVPAACKPSHFGVSFLLAPARFLEPRSPGLSLLPSLDQSVTVATGTTC